MWMHSEKSIKGLSHNYGGVKSQEEQGLSPASPWPGMVSPQQEKSTHPTVAPTGPCGLYKGCGWSISLWFFSHGVSNAHFLRAWPKQTNLFLPPSGWQGTRLGDTC